MWSAVLRSESASDYNSKRSCTEFAAASSPARDPEKGAPVICQALLGYVFRREEYPWLLESRAWEMTMALTAWRP